MSLYNRKRMVGNTPARSAQKEPAANRRSECSGEGEHARGHILHSRRGPRAADDSPDEPSRRPSGRATVPADDGTPFPLEYDRSSYASMMLTLWHRPQWRFSALAPTSNWARDRRGRWMPMSTGTHMRNGRRPPSAWVEAWPRWA